MSTSILSQESLMSFFLSVFSLFGGLFSDTPPVVPETTTPTTPEVSLIQWEEQELFAVALLNYDYEKTEFDSVANDYLEQYLGCSLEDSAPRFELDGTELYLIIPRDPSVPVDIYELDFGVDDLEKGELLYSVVDEPYFILNCNVSDLFANVLLEGTSNGEEYSFSPSISLRDGTLNAVTWMKDITSYPDWVYEEMEQY